MAIPFNQLRFAGGSGPGTWGFEAFRSYPRNVRHRISSRFTDRNKACVLCQENKVTGLRGMAPGRNIELDPTVTARRIDTRDVFPSGPVVAGPTTGDVGLTARWGVTPNLTMSGAANPDFSQVEADVAQLDVNTRFALFYPEKRPFFLEGIDYFATPLQAVFTRTVADPSGGVKLTGKSGANAVGVFATRDWFNSFVLPSNQSSDFASTDDEVTGAVVRYRRDVATRSTVGLLYAGREAGPYHNRVVGPDAFVRISPSDSVRLQVLHSDTAYPASVAGPYGQKPGSFGGTAVFAEDEHASRTWVWYGAYQDLGRDFRADSGFVPRVDTREIDGGLQRRFWGRTGGWFTRAQVGLSGSRVEDHDGQLTDQSVAIRGYYQGPYQSEAQGGFSRNREVPPGHGLRSRPGQPHRVRAAQRRREGQSGPARRGRNRRGQRAQGDRLAAGSRRRVEAGQDVQSPGGAHLRAARRRGGMALHREPLSGPRRLPLRRAGVRARHRAVHRRVARSGPLHDAGGLREPPAVQPVPVLLQAESADRSAGGDSDNYSGLAGVTLAQTNRTFFFKVGYAWVM